MLLDSFLNAHIERVNFFRVENQQVFLSFSSFDRSTYGEFLHQAADLSFSITADNIYMTFFPIPPIKDKRVRHKYE